MIQKKKKSLIRDEESNQQKVTIFEAFAGIGATYKALKNVANDKNWIVTSVGIIEWFIPAIIAYNAIHYTIDYHKIDSFNDKYQISLDSKKPVSKNWIKNNANHSKIGYHLKFSETTAHNLFDISKINYEDIPHDIDIFTYSFPCQDISIQGKGKGFEKNTNTRSGLLWEIEKILDYKHIHHDLPKYLLLENVKAILNKNHLPTFQSWLDKLEQLNYESKVYVLNSKMFGSSQVRERVFVLSVLKEFKKEVGFEFEELENAICSDQCVIKDILINDIEFSNKWAKYPLVDQGINSNNIRKYELLNYTKFNSENYVFDINYNGPTLTASGALSRLKLFFNEHKIREMIPQECFRYMGFSDEDYEAVKKTKLINNSKLIYLCGNSISVEVLEAIFKSLKFNMKEKYFKLKIPFASKAFIKNNPNKLSLKGNAYFIFNTNTQKVVDEYIELIQANFRQTDINLIKTHHYKSSIVKKFRDKFLDRYTNYEISNHYQLVDLKQTQLNEINKALKQLSITIKTMYSLFSGSNIPSGEVNNKNSPIRCIDKDLFDCNFANVLKKFSSSKKEKIKNDWSNLKEYSLIELLNNNLIKNFKSVFKEYNKDLEYQFILNDSISSYNEEILIKKTTKKTTSNYKLPEKHLLYIDGIVKQTIEYTEESFRKNLCAYFNANVKKAIRENKIPYFSINVNKDMNIENVRIIAFSKLKEHKTIASLKAAIDPYNCIRIDKDTHSLIHHNECHFDASGNVIEADDKVKVEHYLDLDNMPNKTKQYFNIYLNEMNKNKKILNN